MLPNIIFCTAVSIAILTVALLTLFSPVPHAKNPNDPWLALSLYIQQSQVPSSGTKKVAQSRDGALLFHRKLTQGPENTSLVIGKAQGFIIPVQHFAHSAFNLIYLSFHTREYSGSLSVEAKNFAHKERGKLDVVGGTGSFAFARGFAVFTQIDHEFFHLKLHLKFPNRSHTIP
ncbi:hypothetical protein RHGRI_031572 [Rhododendron griersonianum]|uniref:Dirigent protein n=1 Tax=Rhododendron griersonianum TaxID=479676 RepID=A0AAV6I8F9_9ERIC|nr:hypothetical protein RHGRI_031572 [Rhododendron griersonianum]